MSNKHLFLDVYYEYLLYAKKEQKNYSFQSMKQKFDKHILPFFEKFYLEDITSKDILNWEYHITELNFSNNFNKNLYYVLSGFLEYCRKFYNFDKSIISNVGCFKKKYETDKHDFYTKKEFKKFISCVDDEIYKQFFNTMFYTGMRPGEAMALKFSDLSKRYIDVNKTIESHGKRLITTPKTRSSNRLIAIPKKLSKRLYRLKEIYALQYPFNDNLFIFGGQKPLSPSTINRRKKNACEKANIRPITLHQFRHSHATFLLQKKIVINEVSRRLGHSKVSTTLDVYTHTDITQEKRVLHTLNSIDFLSFQSMKQKFKSILKRLLPL